VYDDGLETEEKYLAQTFELGKYAFAGAESLGPGERYYVRFGNDDDDPRFLGRWIGPDITSYAAGQALHGGDLDIADVPLTSPAGGSSLTLPADFGWGRRTFNSYTYRWMLYDDASGETWFSEDLGDVGAFHLESLPDGAELDRDYFWLVLVFDGPDAFGISYYMRGVRFTQGAAPAQQAVINGPQSRRPSPHRWQLSPQ
jgi:hypothetical protein